MARKKKKNYRLRKSVRRTFGALFMISAIIIAAIPFPDAAATETPPSNVGDTNTSQPENDLTQVELPNLGNPYSYAAIEGDLPNDLPSVYGNDVAGIDFKKTDADTETSGTLKKAMYIRQTDDGKDYMLVRQFDFVVRKLPDNKTYGVITKYYDIFPLGELIVNSSVITDYETAFDTDITTFYTTNANVTHTYGKTDGDKTQTNEEFFRDFYPKDYKDYISGQRTTPLECTPATDLSDANKLIYYCWYQGFKGYTLFSVKDKASDNNPVIPEDGSDPRIYVMKAIDGYEYTSIPQGYFDSEGYITGGGASIIAIGENAFTGVENVDKIILPGDIKYIANDAFSSSFVDNVVVQGATAIGHRAFKNCIDLVNVDLPYATIYGAEAFYNCRSLTNVSFNSKVSNIYKGAFANCHSLNNVDLSTIVNDCTIGEGAFFNCPLSSLNFGNTGINKLEKGAFASNDVQVDKLTMVDMSESRISSYGEYVFSGREKLTDIIMSGSFGSNNNLSESERTLPETIFLGCYNLGRVKFPESCKYVLYGKTIGDNIDYGQDENGNPIKGSAIFTTITNREFYVEGPAQSQLDKPAYQREETWNCRNGAKDYVPYMYSENGQEFYEVKSGSYLLGLNIDKANKTAVVQKCELLPSATTDGTLKIQESVGPYSIIGFAEGCFNDPAIKSSLKNLTINDTIQTIGREVFKDCSNLEKVTIGKSVNSIGDGAFENCTNLEKVIFTRSSEEVSGFPVGSIGSKAFTTGGEKLIFEGVILEGYAPFEWAMSPDNYAHETNGTRVCFKSPKPQEMYVILDNVNQLATLVHYPHYQDLAYEYSDGETVDIRTKNDNGEKLNIYEENMVKATQEIIIPAGVESIDIKGFLNNTSQMAVGDKKTNNYSIAAYFGEPVSAYSLEADNDLEKLKNYKETYAKYGLFNGECGDASNSSSIQDELKSIGNDRIQRVEMSTVKYLPTLELSSSADDPIAKHDLAVGAFYSCEDLDTVVLGDALQDLGTLPFLGCYKLTAVTDNSTYTEENGILYKTLPDGTYEIIEVLGSKEGYINVAENPMLANVSSIAVGAFSDCPKLKDVSFKDMSLLEDIPEKCFLGAGDLDVLVTEQIRTIGRKAFAESEDVTVTVLGKEVGLSMDSFENTKKALLKSYLDSAASNSADIAGAELEIIEEVYTAKFVDHDGSEFEGEDYAIQEGIPFMGYAKDPKIDFENKHKREGYKWIGWYPDYTTTPITKDQEFVAQYVTDEEYYNKPDTENPGTNTPGTNTPGNNTPGTNTPGTNTPGTNTPGNIVNGGIDTDGDGIPDVDANGNKLYKLTVTNGEGSGYYPAGKTVTIKAGNAPKGTTFAYWSCSDEDLIFDDRTDWITTLTMISSDVTVICNFTGQYTLEVEYGSGSGSYPAGAKVAISAVEAPQGRKFASWVTKTNGLNIENSKKETTVITMPASHAKITATYMDTGSISGNSTPSKNNTSIVITKPGISDKNTASAYVSGSTDNFIVKISESLEAADEVQKALQKKYSDMSRIKYFAMDISLYDAKGVNKITDTTGLKVNITIPIPDALREYAGNNRVGAVVNGNLETLNPKFTTINGVPSVTFTATHFSPYTIYVDTGNMTVSSVPDSTPKTGDGIHPKWFLSIGLACISIILFTKKDRRYTAKAYR